MCTRLVEASLMAKCIRGISIGAVITQLLPAESWRSSFRELPEILVQLYIRLSEKYCIPRRRDVPY